MWIFQRILHLVTSEDLKVFECTHTLILPENFLDLQFTTLNFQFSNLILHIKKLCLTKYSWGCRQNFETSLLMKKIKKPVLHSFCNENLRFKQYLENMFSLKVHIEFHTFLLTSHHSSYPLLSQSFPQTAIR